MAYTRPGVYVSEAPLRTSARRPNSTSIAAFFGTAERGSTTPFLIDSWASYKTEFGDFNQNYDLGFAVYHYFANGGRVAYVTRVAGASAAAATTSNVTYTPSTGASATSLLTATAKSVGTWGNALKVKLSAGKVTASATQIPTFNLTVLRTVNGTDIEVESWLEVSPNPASSRYVKQIIDTYSAFIQIDSVATVAAAEGFAYSTASAVSLASGSDGDSSDLAARYAAALDTLDDIEGSLLINCVGQSNEDIVNDALATAEARGNSFVIIDPDPTKTTATDIRGLISLYTESGYGAVYYPMLKMVDPSKSGPSAIRTTYPGGALAGIYTRTDAQRSVAKTPAGYDTEVRNALGLAFNTSETFISNTYDYGINSLKAVPGAGIVVLGGRTLQGVKPDKYVAVRRTLNYVKQGALDLSRSAVFEPNGPLLWATLESRLSNFLRTFWGQGGLKGQTSQQAFYVTCDSTNNTPTTIDNGEVHIEIGIALQYPAEFIVITISQWTGGSNTVETL